MIVENYELKVIVAMRGRNPLNTSDRTTGAKTEQRLEVNSSGICNTITIVQKDNMVLEKNIPRGIMANNDGAVCTEETVMIKQATSEGHIACKIGGVADLSYPTSKTRRGRVQGNGDICPTITASETGIYRIESMYRIRKLTPRECGRLMDVSDENITRMQEVNCDSQLYKQYGNSIVRRVMIAMFSNLNIQGLPNWKKIKEKYTEK